MKLICIVMLLTLVTGCQRKEETAIDNNAWLCTKIGKYEQKEMMVAGKAVIPTIVTKTGCVQWTRMEAVNESN